MFVTANVTFPVAIALCRDQHTLSATATQAHTLSAYCLYSIKELAVVKHQLDSMSSVEIPLSTWLCSQLHE